MAVEREENQRSGVTPKSAETDGCGSADGAVNLFSTTKIDAAAKRRKKHKIKVSELVISVFYEIPIRNFDFLRDRQFLWSKTDSLRHRPTRSQPSLRSSGCRRSSAFLLSLPPFSKYDLSRPSLLSKSERRSSCERSCQSSTSS